MPILEMSQKDFDNLSCKDIKTGEYISLDEYVLRDDKLKIIEKYCADSGGDVVYALIKIKKIEEESFFKRLYKCEDFQYFDQYNANVEDYSFILVDMLDYIRHLKPWFKKNPTYLISVDEDLYQDEYPYEVEEE